MSVFSIGITNREKITQESEEKRCYVSEWRRVCNYFGITSTIPLYTSKIFS